MTPALGTVDSPAGTALGRNWKVPSILGVVTLLALVLFVLR